MCLSRPAVGWHPYSCCALACSSHNGPLKAVAGEPIGVLVRSGLATLAQAGCAALDSMSLTIYLPCLQLSLVEMPQYDFALEVYGGKAGLQSCRGAAHRKPYC